MSATTSPATAMISAGPSPCQSRSGNAIGAMWSCSKPSQPLRASRWTRNASCQAWRLCTRTNGLDARNAVTISASESARRRQRCHAATISGTTRKTPGYLKPIARPDATPASSRRPDTISASAAPTPSVSGTSVTASCEYATWVVQTAVATAATAPATLPYADRPSHQAAAPAPRAATSGTTAPPQRLSGRRSLDGRVAVADETGDVAYSDDDRIDSRPLQLVDLLAIQDRNVRDRELSRRNVRKQLERAAD